MGQYIFKRRYLVICAYDILLWYSKIERKLILIISSNTGPFMSMIKTKNVIVIEKSNENDFENLSLASKLSICHLLNNIKGK